MSDPVFDPISAIVTPDLPLSQAVLDKVKTYGFGPAVGGELLRAVVELERRLNALEDWKA